MLREQLTRAWSLRGNQDQVLWRIFGAFWPTNAILLVALFRSGQQSPARPVGLISCAAGIFVAACWFLIQRRAIGHVRRLEAVAERLEQALNTEADYALSTGLNHRDSNAFLSGPPARTVMQWCTAIVGVIWLLGLAYFACAVS